MQELLEVVQCYFETGLSATDTTPSEESKKRNSQRTHANRTREASLQQWPLKRRIPINIARWSRTTSERRRLTKNITPNRKLALNVERQQNLLFNIFRFCRSKVEYAKNKAVQSRFIHPRWPYWHLADVTSRSLNHVHCWWFIRFTVNGLMTIAD